MRNADYWLRVALMRELDAHNRGAYTIQELRRMYDSIIKDIDKEIKKIFNTYKSGVQITTEEADKVVKSETQGSVSKSYEDSTANDSHFLNNYRERLKPFINRKGRVPSDFDEPEKTD